MPIAGDRPNAPSLTVSPNPAMVDDALSIHIVNCLPGQRVTLRARVEDSSGKVSQSAATFVADERGGVNLSEQAPVEGSYRSADAMGLIWSLAPQAGGEGLRILQAALDPIMLELSLEVNGEVVATERIERRWVAPGVERIPVRAGDLRGTLFLPPGEGPHPAIILVSGSGGGVGENRAALFASHGYAAFTLAYFAYEDRPPDLAEIPLEYFGQAIEWLQSQPRVDAERIAVTGGSRGGELSLLLGAMFPQIKVVVAYVASGYAWGGFSKEGEVEKPAWTYRGEPVPYVIANRRRPLTPVAERPPQMEPLALTPHFLARLDECDDPAAAEIAVEQTNGAILLVSGEDDQMWPCSMFSDLVMERLKRHGFRHPYRHLRYPGAGHAIVAPYVSTMLNTLKHPVDNGSYALGGNPQDQAFANADSWTQVLKFLAENL